MGSGRSRSNIQIVSAGHQVAAGTRSSAISCMIDQDVPANTEAVPDVTGRVGTVEVARDGNVRLNIEGHPVVLLHAGDLASRLQACTKRGYRFVGIVLAPGLVRVCNE